MRELQLKHIIPYADEGLYGLFGGKKDILSGIDSKNKIVSSLNYGNYYLYDFKPILIPLSYLTKEVIDSFNLDISAQILLNDIRIRFILPEDLPYKYFKILIENHFDVFGLIEEGLAIDINTLNIK